MASLSIRTIERAERADLADIESLYREAFPPSERKPAKFLEEAVARDDYQLIHARGASGFVGMALLYRSRANDFALLEYMAIADEARGQGYGSALFADIVSRVEEPLLLEVESVLEDRPGAPMRKYRQDFYRRLGCLTIEGMAYLMPKVSHILPPPMDIMIEGFPGRAVPRAALQTWLEDIYVRVYGRSAADPDIDRMMGPIGAAANLI